MAHGTGKRQRAGNGSGSDRHRGSDVDPGLSVQPSDEEGSGGIADLRLYGEEYWKRAAAYSLLRGDGWESPKRPRGRPRRDGRTPGYGGRLRAGDDGNGGDGIRREANGLPPIEEINPSQLAHVENRHWRQALEATSSAAKERVRDGDGILDKAAALDACTDQALARTLEILHIPLAGLDPRDLARVGSLVHTTAQGVLRTQVQVDEQRLKRKGVDLLPQILAKMEEQRKRLQLEDGTPARYPPVQIEADHKMN